MLQFSKMLKEPVALQPQERATCNRITSFIIIQCMLVFSGSLTIYCCVWSPYQPTEDYDKLARIMYLYDSDACGHRIHSAGGISNLRLSNDTHGCNVLPIRWEPAVVTVAARFSAATRWYLNFSVGVHVAWMLSAVLLRIFVASTSSFRYLKFFLSLFLYVSISVVAFDLSMAIVYASHIKKSLTKGMILRYSGWSVEMKLQDDSDFGGWIPIIAAICWMRGVVIMFINIYCCRAIRLMRRGVRKREVKRRLTLSENQPLPEAKFENPSDDNVLYYRTGEYIPYAGNTSRHGF